MAFTRLDKRTLSANVRPKRSSQAALKALWRETFTDAQADELVEAIQEANLAASRLINRLERVETALSICRQEIQTARDIAADSHRASEVRATEANRKGTLSA